jgi:Porin subfamily
MKLAKSLLLGSAAGLSVVAGAQAADLAPVRKAAPVEYVRVCTAYGAGFFYIPGTDTCLRVGGRARYEFEYRTQRSTGPSNNGVNTVSSNDQTGSRGLGRLNLDARTQTAYGTLRAFVRFEIAKRTGSGIDRSGTIERGGGAFFGTGVDEFGRAQTQVNIDKAFIQFAGITAGRAASFFDFYAHDLEFNPFTSGSDISATNLLAYTFTFGNGFTATVSAEDPTERRGNFFNVGGTLSGFGATGPTVIGAGGGFGSGSTTQPVAFSAFGTPVGVTFDAAGNPITYNLIDVRQRNRMPDFVGNLRVDQAWGSAQISGAVHELAIGQNIVSGTLLNGTAVSGNTGVVGGVGVTANPCGTGATATGFVGAPAVGGVNCVGARKPNAEYGFGVQGGLKINLPMIAAGDLLYLQAAYGDGAVNYTGAWSYLGRFDNTQAASGRFPIQTDDAVVDAFGRTHTTKAFSITGALLHYWLPELRSGLYGSYATVDYDAILRTAQGPAGLAPFAFAATSAGNTTSNPTLAALSPIFRDYNIVTAGANLIWSPVKDLDIGIEGQYIRVSLDKGVVIDQSKNFAVTPSGTLVTTASANVSPIAVGGIGAIPKTVSYDDQFIGRFRIQRDF